LVELRRIKTYEERNIPKDYPNVWQTLPIPTFSSEKSVICQPSTEISTEAVKKIKTRLMTSSLPKFCSETKWLRKLKFK
jgi:hypothetical protein